MRFRNKWNGKDTFYDAWILRNDKIRDEFPYEPVVHDTQVSETEAHGSDNNDTLMSSVTIEEQQEEFSEEEIKFWKRKRSKHQRSPQNNHQNDQDVIIISSDEELAVEDDQVINSSMVEEDQTIGKLPMAYDKLLSLEVDQREFSEEEIKFWKRQSTPNKVTKRSNNNDGEQDIITISSDED